MCLSRRLVSCLFGRSASPRKSWLQIVRARNLMQSILRIVQPGPVLLRGTNPPCLEDKVISNSRPSVLRERSPPVSQVALSVKVTPRGLQTRSEMYVGHGSVPGCSFEGLRLTIRVFLGTTEVWSGMWYSARLRSAEEPRAAGEKKALSLQFVVLLPKKAVMVCGD